MSEELYFNNAITSIRANKKNNFDKLINSTFENLVITPPEKGCLNLEESISYYLNTIETMTNALESNNGVIVYKKRENSKRLEKNKTFAIKTKNNHKIIKIRDGNLRLPTEICRKEETNIRNKKLKFSILDDSSLNPMQMPILHTEENKLPFNFHINKQNISNLFLTTEAPIQYLPSINSSLGTILIKDSNKSNFCSKRDSILDQKRKLDMVLENFIKKSKSYTSKLNERIEKEKESYRVIKQRREDRIPAVLQPKEFKAMEVKFKQDLKKEIQKNNEEHKTIFLYEINRKVNADDINLMSSRRKKVGLEDMLNIDNMAAYKFKKVIEDKFGMNKRVNNAEENKFEEEKEMRKMRHDWVENMIEGDNKRVYKFLHRK